MAYYQSKLAQVLFTRHLQQLIDNDEDCHVQVHAVHPGLVDTDIFVHSSTNYVPWIKRILFKVCVTLRIWGRFFVLFIKKELNFFFH